MSASTSQNRGSAGIVQSRLSEGDCFETLLTVADVAAGAGLVGVRAYPAQGQRAPAPREAGKVPTFFTFGSGDLAQTHEGDLACLVSTHRLP
jgi:hypothetical protein